MRGKIDVISGPSLNKKKKRGGAEEAIKFNTSRYRNAPLRYVVLSNCHSFGQEKREVEEKRGKDGDNEVFINTVENSLKGEDEVCFPTTETKSAVFPTTQSKAEDELASRWTSRPRAHELENCNKSLLFAKSRQAASTTF